MNTNRFASADSVPLNRDHLLSVPMIPLRGTVQGSNFSHPSQHVTQPLVFSLTGHSSSYIDQSNSCQAGWNASMILNSSTHRYHNNFSTSHARPPYMFPTNHGSFSTSARFDQAKHSLDASVLPALVSLNPLIETQSFTPSQSIVSTTVKDDEFNNQNSTDKKSLNHKLQLISSESSDSDVNENTSASLKIGTKCQENDTIITECESIEQTLQLSCDTNITQQAKDVSSNFLTQHTGKLLYKCGHCGMKFSSNESLLRHVNIHTDKMHFTCGLCSLSFIEGTQLILHVQDCHNVSPAYACGICSRKFDQNTKLQNHIEDHHKEKKSCVTQDSNVGTPSHHPNTDSAADQDEELEEGNMKSVEEKNEELSNNGNKKPNSPVFSNCSDHTIIINKHTSFKQRKEPSKIVMDDVDLNAVCEIIVEPSSGTRIKHLYKCKFCEKVCKDKGSMVSHARTHTKGRPYHCKDCSATFKQYAHLKDHVITKHNKTRQFVCDRCARSFNRKSHLQDHIRLKHTEDKLHHCTQCSLTFHTRVEFSEHKRSHGTAPKYQCHVCQRQFRNVTDYERHTRSHTNEKRFECEICHLKFSLLANAKKHMIKHSEVKPFKCDVCPKAYHFEHDFKRHKASHLNKKPFPCSQCYKSFKTASLLKKHIKITHSNNGKTLNNANTKDDKQNMPLKTNARKMTISVACLYCQRKFSSERLLNRHMQNSKCQTVASSGDDNDIKARFDSNNVEVNKDCLEADIDISEVNSLQPNKQRSGRRPQKQKITCG